MTTPAANKLILSSNVRYAPHTLLSIGVPTYKRVDLLKETLDSIAAQKSDFSLFKVNVVDNSHDDEQTKELVAQYPFCNYYRNSENIGMVGNNNQVIALCDTPWCAIVHDDDMLCEDYVSTALDLIEKHSNYKLFAFNNLIKNEITNSEIFYPSFPTLLTLEPYRFIIENPINMSGVLINVKAWQEFGGFSQDYYPSFDYQLWSQIAQKYRVGKYFSQKPMSIYRIERNVSTKIQTTKKMYNSIEMTVEELIRRRNFILRMIWRSYNRYRMYLWVQSAIDLFHPHATKHDTDDLIRETGAHRYNIFDRITFKLVNTLIRINNKFGNLCC